MSHELEELISKALDLPERDRAALASRLLESLGSETALSDDEWLDEIERRAQRAVSGESQGIPAEDVFELARLRIKKGR